MRGGDVLRRPDTLPGGVDVRVNQLPFEIQQEPTVTEVEMRVVTARVHQLVHFRICNLNCLEGCCSGLTEATSLEFEWGFAC